MATINAIGSQDPIQVAFGGTGLATLTQYSLQVGAGDFNRYTTRGC